MAIVDGKVRKWWEAEDARTSDKDVCVRLRGCLRVRGRWEGWSRERGRVRIGIAGKRLVVVEDKSVLGVV